MFHLLDPLTVIKTIGIIGVFAFIFAESGLFFGFFLPGDSLLFTAGLLASQNWFSIWYLIFGCIFAAILGDSVGYAFGTYLGPRIFIKDESFFFKKSHIERSRNFYIKYGPKAIVLSRFVPVVRTFVPILAGVGLMPYRTFLTFNIIGGLLWTVCLTGLGFFLGSSIPNVDKYVLPIVLLIIVVSVAPIAFEYWKSRGKQAL
jgi:membrane-associated protein